MESNTWFTTYIALAFICFLVLTLVYTDRLRSIFWELKFLLKFNYSPEKNDRTFKDLQREKLIVPYMEKLALSALDLRKEQTKFHAEVKSLEYGEAIKMRKNLNRRIQETWHEMAQATKIARRCGFDMPDPDVFVDKFSEQQQAKDNREEKKG